MRTYEEICRDCEAEYDELSKAEKMVVHYAEMLKYAPRLVELMEQGLTAEMAVVWILDLWQDYRICEETESALYKIADPRNEYNDVYELWYNVETENPLIDEARRWA